jgi:hypothetical protein
MGAMAAVVSQRRVARRGRTDVDVLEKRERIEIEAQTPPERHFGHAQMPR